MVDRMDDRSCTFALKRVMLFALLYHFEKGKFFLGFFFSLVAPKFRISCPLCVRGAQQSFYAGDFFSFYQFWFVFIVFVAFYRSCTHLLGAINRA